MSNAVVAAKRVHRSAHFTDLHEEPEKLVFQEHHCHFQVPIVLPYHTPAVIPTRRPGLHGGYLLVSSLRRPKSIPRSTNTRNAKLSSRYYNCPELVSAGRIYRVALAAANLCGGVAASGASCFLHNFWLSSGRAFYLAPLLRFWEL